MNDENGPSVAQLLTEEWMVDASNSSLPSFLETMWMQETDRSISDGLRTLLRMIRDRGVRPLLQRLPLQSADRSDALASHAKNAFLNKWAQWQRTFQRQLLCCVVVLLQQLDRVLDQYRRELQLILRYVLERHMLRNSRGTLADVLFGMVRVRAATTMTENGRMPLVPLERNDQIRLALLQALLPYLWDRCQEQYDNRGMPRTHVSPTNVPWSVGQQIRVALYRRGMPRVLPILLSLLYGANAYCQLLFLLGLSHYTDGRNTLLRHIVRRALPGDLRQSSDSNAETRGKMSLVSTVGWILLVSGVSLSWLTHMIHWYQEKYQEMQQAQLRREQMEQHPAVPTSFPAHILPVPLLPPDAASLPTKKENCCLLCHKPWLASRQSAALNGYIYCYTCIVLHVRQHGLCPVTDQAVREEQVIRLYYNTTKT